MAADADPARPDAGREPDAPVTDERVSDEREAGAHVAEEREPRPTFGARVGAAVKEAVIVLAMALTFSFVVKTFLVQAFYIPSESMEDTLLVGDRVVVSKLTPGPFDLHRGDVVVFADPGDWLNETPPANHGAVLNAVRDGLTFVGLLPDTSEGHLIKRVIGLPGDRIQSDGQGGRLKVNGQEIDESSYLKAGASPSTVKFDITVPAGKVWVMGDNRGDSSDSRFHDPSGTGADGSVPIDLVVGRARVTVWPVDRAAGLSNHAEVFADVPEASSAG